MLIIVVRVIFDRYDAKQGIYFYFHTNLAMMAHLLGNFRAIPSAQSERDSEERE